MSLGPSDVFDVRVFGEPDLSSTYRVGTDGKISFPLIGQVHVQGKTTTILAEELQKRLEQFVKRPQVSVLLKESNSKKVTIYGQVQHPGTIQYSEQMTISQAVSMAGGLTAMAARESARVKRKRNGQTETIVVNLKAVANGTETYYLQPGDEVFVPERLF
jgi:polysaccharide export outer membrane protein